MKRIIMAAPITVAWIAAASAQGFGPAVTVGSTEIPRAKIEAQVNHLVNERGLGSGGITQPATYRQIQEEVVEQMVVQELLWQEAQRRDFVVSSDEVDVEMQKIKSNFNSQLAFEFSIKEGGYTEASFWENIRQQRSVRRMVAEDIVASISVDAADVARFYEENVDQMQIPEQVRARQILVELAANADDATREAAYRKLEAIRAEILAGASFALTAIEHSEGASAPQGGDLGYFERGQMVAPFEQAAFSLEPGEVSGIVATEYGLHLIKVEDHVRASAVSLADATPQIRDYLGQQRLERELSNLIDSLRADNQVEIYLW